MILAGRTHSLRKIGSSGGHATKIVHTYTQLQPGLQMWERKMQHPRSETRLSQGTVRALFLLTLTCVPSCQQAGRMNFPLKKRVEGKQARIIRSNRTAMQ